MGDAVAIMGEKPEILANWMAEIEKKIRVSVGLQV